MSKKFLSFAICFAVLLTGFGGTIKAVNPEDDVTCDFVKLYLEETEPVVKRTEISCLTSGNLAGVAKLTNNTGKDKSVLFLMALYRNDVLNDIQLTGETIPSNETKDVEAELALICGDDAELKNYSIKMFVWEMDIAGNTTIRPLSGAYTFSSGNSFDIVVYGGTASGIIAAVQASKMGKSVAVIEPGTRIGGLTTGGLSDTDAGHSDSIGGLSLEFYKRVGRKYNSTSPVWMFEPKVALEVMHDLVEEYNIPVFYNERMDLENGVEKSGTDIISVTMESGTRFYAKMFIDATYEGDLMAKAGVSYSVGRESNSTYGEKLNGIRYPNEHNPIPNGIDPYNEPGNPNSGLIARVNPNKGGLLGDGDNKIQAYNFRWTLTDDPNNRVMVEKPEGYKEEDYEILFRSLEKGMSYENCFKVHAWLQSGRKVDANNNSGASTDYIGMNYDYPDGDYETRERIIKEHEIYQKGLLWTLQNHERVPQNIRDALSKWGLPKDEFLDNGHFPSQIYVREARRMVSDFVITDNVVRGDVPVSDSVGQGSYPIDSHHVQYCVDNGYVFPEGDMSHSLKGPYPISYRSIIPKADECTNLFVPICVSASHAAFGSLRMEPVFMILGQSAATAASMAIDNGISAQELSYAELSERLVSDGQKLKEPEPIDGAPGIVYECEDLICTTSPGVSILVFGEDQFPYNSNGKAVKLNSTKAGDYIEFTVNVAKPGTYPIRVMANGHPTRGTFKLFFPDEGGGVYLGETKDQYYHSQDRVRERLMPIDFGEITFATAGNKKFRFIVNGKNASSTGYTLAFDYIKLITAE